MEYLTAQKIVKIVEDDMPNETNIMKLRKSVDNMFYQQDDSNLWPINGRFNVTKRAINRIKRAEREGLVLDDLLAYALTLENIMSEIVNKY